MRHIRLILMVLSAIGAIGLIATAVEGLSRRYGAMKGADAIVIIGFASLFALNAYYVSKTEHTSKPSRLFRLYDLWMAAKEKELGDRAKGRD